MSEAMKTEAIEDVLSSVRRLVSDTTSSQTANVEIAKDRLVLTPELRVSETADEADTAGEAESEAPATLSIDDLLNEAGEDESPDPINIEWSPDDRMANWDDVGQRSESSDTFEPVQGDKLGADETSGAVARAVAEARFLDGDVDKATQPETEGEAAVTELLEGSSREGVSDVNDALPDDLEKELAALNGTGDVAEGPEVAPETEPMPDTEAEAETPIFARINRAVIDLEPQVEASAQERVVELGAQIDEASGDDALEDQVEDLGHRGAAFGFGDDESVLDEEVLREIIAEVVREELQGVLGQRITRNVRKLVRREIRLALAAEELG